MATQRVTGLDSRQSPAVPRGGSGRCHRRSIWGRRRSYSRRGRALSSSRSQFFFELIVAFLIQPHLLQPGTVSRLPAALELSVGPQRGSSGGRSLLLLLPLPFFLFLLTFPPPSSSASSEAFLPLPRAHQRLCGFHVPASTSRAEPGGDTSAGLFRRGRPGRPGARLAVLGLQHSVISAPQPAAAVAPLPFTALRPPAAQTWAEEAPRPRPTLRSAPPRLHQDDSGDQASHASAVFPSLCL